MQLNLPIKFVVNATGTFTPPTLSDADREAMEAAAKAGLYGPEGSKTVQRLLAEIHRLNQLQAKSQAA